MSWPTIVGGSGGNDRPNSTSALHLALESGLVEATQSRCRCRAPVGAAMRGLSCGFTAVRGGIQFASDGAVARARMEHVERWSIVPKRAHRLQERIEPDGARRSRCAQQRFDAPKLLDALRGLCDV